VRRDQPSGTPCTDRRRKRRASGPSIETRSGHRLLGFAQVLLEGFGPELDQLERVHRVERLEDALPGLERQIQEAAESVDELQCGSVLAGRIAGTVVDSWTPTIVLVAEPVAPASLERLAVITSTGIGPRSPRLS
jgi:hypothetical protein